MAAHIGWQSLGFDPVDPAWFAIGNGVIGVSGFGITSRLASDWRSGSTWR